MKTALSWCLSRPAAALSTTVTVSLWHSNRTIYQIEMMPEKVDNVQQTLDALRSVVDLTDDDIAAFRKERARSHRFTSIPVKTNLTEVQVARFAVNQYRFPGVEVKGYKRRYYPYGSGVDPRHRLCVENQRSKTSNA